MIKRKRGSGIKREEFEQLVDKTIKNNRIIFEAFDNIDAGSSR